MTRLLSFVFLLFLPSIAAADCVSYNFAPNPGSGFAGFGRFENSCSYQVVIRFRYSDGQTGLAGPIEPGQTERGYHGEARKVEYTWCDFDASSCNPDGLGVGTTFSEDQNALSKGYELYIQEQEADLAYTTCLRNLSQSNRTDECAPEFDAFLAAMEVSKQFRTKNPKIIDMLFSDYLLSRGVSIENPLWEPYPSPNYGYLPNNITNSSSVSGVEGPAASCVSLGWESYDGYQARTVQNTCSRGIVVRVCHVVRVQRGDCQLQLFTNPLEHNFGQLMLDGSRPKWRTNWYQFEGAATNLRFYAKYIQ